ncbi:hypothetical protein C823_002992 [Eubacterium plexicaudatum ASF492]|nr:hypothetical protein C823_002992 [Eubacterium plexicaudatum ASF492]
MTKKYLRLHDDLHLKQEFCIREKDGAYFYIIEMREPQKAEPDDAADADVPPEATQ